jgi:hypothetical protein
MFHPFFTPRQAKRDIQTTCRALNFDYFSIFIPRQLYFRGSGFLLFGKIAFLDTFGP